MIIQEFNAEKELYNFIYVSHVIIYRKKKITCRNSTHIKREGTMVTSEIPVPKITVSQYLLLVHRREFVETTFPY